MRHAVGEMDEQGWHHIVREHERGVLPRENMYLYGVRMQRNWMCGTNRE